MLVARLMYPASVPRIQLVSSGYSWRQGCWAASRNRPGHARYAPISFIGFEKATKLRLENANRTMHDDSFERFRAAERTWFGQCLERRKVGRLESSQMHESPFPPPRPVRDKPWREIDRVTMGSDDIKLRNDRSFTFFLQSSISISPKIFHRFRTRVYYIGSSFRVG